MSVIIKGMAMPETCYECRFCEEEQQYPFRLYCVAHYNLIKYPRTGRLDTCPLVELPDHGDLIDRSRLIGGFADWYIQESPMYLGDSKVVAETIGDAMKAIEAAPVVIPAERSEE